MCRDCQYWNKVRERHTRYDRFGDPIGVMPATGECTYKLPIWLVNKAHTTEIEGADCAVFQLKEDK